MMILNKNDMYLGSEPVLWWYGTAMCINLINAKTRLGSASVCQGAAQARSVPRADCYTWLRWIDLLVRGMRGQGTGNEGRGRGATLSPDSGSMTSVC